MSCTFTRIWLFVDCRHFAQFFDLSRTETDEVQQSQVSQVQFLPVTPRTFTRG
jgi:hypothetical protein